MLAEPPSGRQTIVEGGEIVTDGFEISQAILAHARAFWHPIASDRPASVGLHQTALAASITRAGIW